MCEAKFVVEDSSRAVAIIEALDEKIRESLVDEDKELKISLDIENDLESVLTLAESSKLISMLNGTYIWAYGDYSGCNVIFWRYKN